MDIINRRPGLAALVAFIAGLIIGLVVLGWGLFPVQYSGADPSGLFPEYQAMFVRNAAELYAFDNNQDKLRNALDRKSTRLNSSHVKRSRMPSSA